MPRLIDSGIGDAITLDALVDALDAAAIDPREEDGLASLGPLLAQLGRNPTFLADLAIAELEQRFAGQAHSTYGAQVFLLRPPTGRYVLRANFWPAAADAAFRASGPGAFFYDMPHDHNFSFLTVGYLGPGYWSDYYTFDGAALPLPGEIANLRFVERSRLEEGRVLLYRAHHDVHVQRPPDAFSVSLNILAYDLAQPWRDQLQFDIAGDRIARPLTAAPAEILVTLAAQFGGEDGLGLAAEMLARHPHPRMRATALSALAGAAGEADARAAIFAQAIDDPDPRLSGHARRGLAAALSHPKRR